MDAESVKIAGEVAKEVAGEIYNDGGKPIVKPTGELLGLVPRAIKAALCPVEKWILHKEYNLSETKRLLEEKLRNVPPENIVPPEPHIAVPALQYISYCMDNEELRNMYANLLANSMDKAVKDGVHPGFVEIVKQLCPDEAKVLREIYAKKQIPVIDLKYKASDGGGIIVVRDFSNIGEIAKCDMPYPNSGYFDNLVRLGMIETKYGRSFSDKTLYEPLKQHPLVMENMEIPLLFKEQGFTQVIISEGLFEITSFGNGFCRICIENK